MLPKSINRFSKQFFCCVLPLVIGSTVLYGQTKPTKSSTSKAAVKPVTKTATNAAAKTAATKTSKSEPDKLANSSATSEAKTTAGPPPPVVSRKLSLSRLYHDITCHYNYWYNANMKMDLAIDRLVEGNTDDYTHILPLYNYDTEAGGVSVSGDMDEVIKKTSVGIQLHEKSVWVPDCYYLLGQAYYFKKQYKDALDVYQYIQTKFKAETIKGVAVPEKRFAHKSITNEALLWLIKDYIMMEKYEEAEAITKSVEARKDFPIKLKDELKILHTDVLIRKEEYNQAVIPLTNAISLTKKKAEKVRYTYILAQLHEYGKNNSEAIQTYKRVLAMHPEFVMDFNARMKIVELYSSQPNLPINEVRAILLGMLNDSKYSDYKDQVYYRLAELELRLKNEKGAINYLRQSIAVSTSNIEQKGLSNKKLADIYFGNPKYILAKNRYDSAFLYLPSIHPDYPIVKERKELLEEVVLRIRIIQKEDSLQKLAAMNPADLEKKLLKDLAKQRSKQLNDSLDKISNNRANTENKESVNNASAGGFYFYNPGLKGNGYNDFIKKWGNRPVADDWRRSKKNQKAGPLATVADDKGAEPAAETTTSKSKNPELDKLLANLPNSESKIKASDSKIINAYFELGNLYKDQLKNDKKAIETFEKLVARYPNNKFIQECYYTLYLLYEKTKNYTLSEKYKQKILNEFPQSAFAKILKNPNFISDQDKSKNAVATYYEATYLAYQNGNYEDVISRVNTADEQFKGDALTPKFQLLKALAIGKTRELPEFTASLNTIITSFPNTDVKTKAQDILNAINNQNRNKPVDFQPDKNTAPKVEAAPEKPTGLSYTYVPNSAHFYIIVFNKTSTKNGQVMGALSNFNSKNHSLDNLVVEQQLLNAETQLAVVKTFASADKAFEFFDEVAEEEKSIFKGMPRDQFSTILISQTNFELLQKDGDLENYRNFFEEKYQSQ
jgi:tetratricopeptide (TPR) repeat protein